MSEWNDKIIAEFRENNGIVGGPFANMKLLILTTIGAKSGEKRVSPVAYFPYGDDRVIVASKGGHPKHPGWYHNLVADTHVHVEAAVDGGTEEYEAIARVLDDGEHAVEYPEIVKRSPQFGVYQEKTERKIPLVALKRVG